MCIATITILVKSQENERTCVLQLLHYLYKARKMSGHVSHDRSFTWLCTGSVMVTIHMTGHLPRFVQVVLW
jgi:hypothetical protein